MTKRLIKPILLLLLSVICVVGLFALVNTAGAQVQEGLTAIQEETGLSTTDPRLVVANVIRTFLGILGIILVCVIIYGGFVWMTAGGETEKVEKAKKILINGVIGFIIIVASYAITSFVIGSILNATGGDGTSGGSSSTDYDYGLGGGSTASFVVTVYRPDSEVLSRNIKHQTTFSRAIDPSSVDGAIVIENSTTGEEVDGTYEVSANKISFVPSTPCPEPNQDRFCFEENTTFAVTVSSSILSTTGTQLRADCGGSCTSTFTSGSIIDTEDPDVTLALPEGGDRTEPNSLILVMAGASDDGELSVANFSSENVIFDAVPATGDDLSEVTFESSWDNSSVEADARYKIAVVVEDLAGNTGSDSVTIRVNPEHCYNRQLDESLGETAIDCGGVCGGCDGDSCEINDDCSSGQCIDGTCKTVPVISNVRPLNGAPGTFVTIAGTGFGSLTGTIEFAETDGTSTPLEIADCSDGWTDTQLVFEVPEGTAGGALSVTTSQGLTDATNDARLPVISDFEVNEVIRPSLCKLTPKRGRPGTTVTLIGHGFGDTQDNTVVNFEADEVETYLNWADERVQVRVPALVSQPYKVAFGVAGELISNSLDYEVLPPIDLTPDAPTEDVPRISYVSPDSGGVGQYVTIVGSGFGGNVGTVWFDNQSTGDSARGSIDFPDACSESFWSRDEVTIIVPDEYDQSNEDIALTTHNLYIETASGETSDPVDFSVTNAEPSPGICALEPNSGPVGTEVLISGTGFGTGEGQVIFYNEAAALDITDWGRDEISTEVPNAATTGPVYVEDASGQRNLNGVQFEVTTGEVIVEEEDVPGAEYAWSFSTGTVPKAPEVIIECSAEVVSGVPNDSFTQDVCVNASVYAEFSQLMNESTLDGTAIIIDECADDDCNTVSETVAGTIETSSSQDSTSFRWSVGPAYNDGRFKANVTYGVTITTAAVADNGLPLEEPVAWLFTTGGDTEDCEVEEVVVRPSYELIEEQGGTSEFLANANTQDCQVLDPSVYLWNWDIDPSMATITAGACESIEADYCAVAEALTEGETEVTASTNGISDSGYLEINFSDPFVESFWPNCETACIDGDVGVSFNIAMEVDSVEASGAAKLLRCDNELCLTFAETIGTQAVCVPNSNGDCTGLSFGALPTLQTDEFYRVILSGEMRSTSGVPMIRSNFGDDFSWIFHTKAENAECSVSRIEIEPAEVTLESISQSQSFRVEAFGDPDSCSVAGQRINPYDYNWSWEDPIIDAPGVAEWLRIGGTLFDVGQSSIPDGCTNTCLAVGSQTVTGLCGNGTIEIGEDCDDDNIANDDGCSSSCLAEGTTTCNLACSDTGESCFEDEDCEGVDATCGVVGSGCCGDGVIDAGELCDDGNVISGDGCSSSCLREGSNAVEAVCGNGDVGRTPDGGGESCDDGNKKGGDGCSAICLNEGTTSQAEITAICGDNQIDEPYETCDDGNLIRGDGCSPQCLREGGNISLCAFTSSSCELDSDCPGSTCEPAICGDGQVQRNEDNAGEDCDGEEYCNRDCTLKGSSAEYSEPSVCGDGEVGLGENSACEVGTAGDNKPDPVQVARIVESAAGAVNVDTGMATSAIRVTLDETGATAEAQLGLSCVAKADADCPTGYGPANNSCCLPRPEVTLYPGGTQGGNGFCRNTAIFAIFTEEMDLASFENNAYVRVQPGQGACPEGHEIYTPEIAMNGSWLQRAWFSIKNFFLPETQAQLSGDCILPLTGFSQKSLEDGTYRVDFKYNTALAANIEYEIFMLGDLDLEDVDEDGRAVTSGVVTKDGVAKIGDTLEFFITGDGFCTLDQIKVIDTDTESPYVFNQFEEEHTFYAETYTRSPLGIEPIQPIDDVYDWEWLDWQEDTPEDSDVIHIAASNGNEAKVRAGLETGSGHIVAQAEIVTNVMESRTCVDGDADKRGNPCSLDSVDEDCGELGICQFRDPSVAGDAEVNTFICANPWPAYGAFPFIDEDLHISTFYCRDAGDEGQRGDLPDVTLVKAPSRGTELPDLLTEYFLRVNDESGDAIGIRAMKNETYLDPMSWFMASGFVGTPEATTIDGFEAVRSGRTVYVAAPNVNPGGSIYPNIYAISYNDGASQTTLNIYEQILDNFELVTNLSVSLCHNGIGYSGEWCTSDLDCLLPYEVCKADKDKVQRDLHRLNNLQKVSGAVRAFGSQNGLCSSTTTQACSQDNDCPAGETCRDSVPQLAAGTFVRGMVSSAWPSWESEFGATLGVPVAGDPLNRYSACGEDTSNANFSSETCVDESQGLYICPVDSYTMHYKAVGQFGYEMMVDLEYREATWAFDFDQDPNDDYKFRIGGLGSDFYTSPYCTDVVLGGNNVCGDGVVGPQETCELGQFGPADACTVSTPNGPAQGYRNQVCNSVCSGYVVDPAAQCVLPSCGNGVIEGAEICDDGSFNGRYGYCGNDCTYSESFFCGDGSLAGGEVCDCGSNASGRSYDGGLCVVANGLYSPRAGDTCSWDCKGPAAYCGDGLVDAAEQCDGNTEEYSGKLCPIGDRRGLPCEVGGEGGDCPDTANNRFVACGCGATWCPWAQECPVATICIAGDTDRIGAICANDADCGTGGACSANPVQTTRTRACTDNSNPYNACQWESDDWSNLYGNYNRYDVGFYTSCRGALSCGNGQVEPGEDCDDGNKDTNDACTNECKNNVCGDGYLYYGVEDCDNGEENDQLCSSSYGSSCTYCTSSCRLASASGSYCGDGVRNGTEFCDGDDIKFYYWDENTQEVLDSCDPALVGTTKQDGDYVCENIGICDGGDDNGLGCDTGAACSGGGECVFPVCSEDCTNTCPFTFTTKPLEVQSNQVGSSRSTSVRLESFDRVSDIVTANSATVFIPACRSANGLSGTISFAGVELSQTYVVFVTDVSGSMGGTSGKIEICVGGPRDGQSCTTNQYCRGIDGTGTCVDTGETRMSVVKDALQTAQTRLFDELGDYVHIGAVAFGDHNEVIDFVDYDNSDELTDKINLYDATGWSTNTADALEEAKSMLDGVATNDPNAVKIIVLMTDGQWHNGDPENPACDSKEAGYDLYTVLAGVSTQATFSSTGEECIRTTVNPPSPVTSCDYGASHAEPLVNELACWSSGNPNADTAIDYAFSGVTQADIEEMYENIIDSILGTTVTFIQGGELNAMIIQEGVNVPLEFPEGFACDPNNEQEMTLRASFNGAGYLEISNLRFKHCAP